jgi:hypothetical protein
MIHSTFNISFNELSLDVSEVEKVLGYRDGDDRELVTELIKEIFIEAAEICRIKSEYIIYSNIEFINIDKSITINRINFETKKIVFGQLKKSESIAVFLCTAGEEIGIRSRIAMQEMDLLRGYILDIVGSVIVDAAADFMQNELEKTVGASGKKVTNRYSPGYCSWQVAEQHKLFQLVPENFCGIKLTESALMDPIKSISGIIGIGKDVKNNIYTCNLCDFKDCVYRDLRRKKA